jgi:hypothetical protein
VSTHIELFATGAVAPAAVWSVVGDLRRLPEWTDVERVEELSDPEPAVGTTFVTVAGDQRLRWRVITAEGRLLEATTETPKGPLAMGLRAAMTQTGGTRLVLVGRLEHPGGFAGLRTRLGAGAALRRRMDRWVHEALRQAG